MPLAASTLPSGVLVPAHTPRFALAGSVLAQEPALAANLAGYWSLDEGGGSTVNDLSGNNTPGTWQGTLGSQWGTGILNGCGVFNGTNNSIQIGDANRYNFERTQPFSISMWLKLTSASTLTLFSKRITTGVTNGYVLLLSAGKPRFTAANSVSGVNYVDVWAPASPVNDGNWHHVGVSYGGTGAASGINLYVDGLSVGMATLKDTLSGSIQSTGVTQIGTTNNLIQWFVGSIDEVGLWSCALPASAFALLAAPGTRPV